MLAINKLDWMLWQPACNHSPAALQLSLPEELHVAPVVQFLSLPLQVPSLPPFADVLKRVSSRALKACYFIADIEQAHELGHLQAIWKRSVIP